MLKPISWIRSNFSNFSEEYQCTVHEIDMDKQEHFFKKTTGLIREIVPIIVPVSSSLL